MTTIRNNKTVIVSLIMLVAFLFAGTLMAQNQKIYISTIDGKKSIANWGRIGYNSSTFISSKSKRDTLLLSGPGYELCQVDIDALNLTAEEKKSYVVLNKVIRIAEKEIGNSGKAKDRFERVLEGRKVKIAYYNAKENGSAEIEIEILSTDLTK